MTREAAERTHIELVFLWPGKREQDPREDVQS